MLQDFISTFKAYYLRQMMRELVQQTEDNRSTIKEFWRNFNINKSWKEVPQQIMNGEWWKIGPSACTSQDSLMWERKVQLDIVNLD
ncbi:Tigger transposable element-derived protein 1-like 203 [Homarus americanus]|uniref:Tigger transposable element-derived protein 1-like 203 n=1 Tax=Homarus americanus TaxID=6706 RepID=A0A8J5MD94_HOMAM|nr:Tigger transposable element-derived protein 1-like 203 [Homarus americanus]